MRHRRWGQRSSEGEGHLPEVFRFHLWSWSCTEGSRPECQEHGASHEQQWVPPVCEAWLLMLHRAFRSSREGLPAPRAGRRDGFHLCHSTWLGNNGTEVLLSREGPQEH